MNDYIRRQDAIDALEKERQYLLAHDMTGAEHILVHHALNVIEGLPSVHTTVHDLPKDADTISRQAAIDTLETTGYDFSDSELSEIELEEVCEAVGDVRQDMINRIKLLPSAQPENNIVSNSGREPTKNDIIMLYHKVYGCTIINAEQAHEKALEYLRDKAMLKG